MRFKKLKIRIATYHFFVTLGKLTWTKRLWLRACSLALAQSPPCNEQTNWKCKFARCKAKHSQLSYSNSGASINNVKMRGDHVSWLRQPHSIAKEIASTFRLHVALRLHFVANNKKEPALLHRLFLG